MRLCGCIVGVGEISFNCAIYLLLMWSQWCAASPLSINNHLLQLHFSIYIYSTLLSHADLRSSRHIVYSWGGNELQHALKIKDVTQGNKKLRVQIRSWPIWRGGPPYSPRAHAYLLLRLTLPAISPLPTSTPASHGVITNVVTYSSFTPRTGGKMTHNWRI